MSRHAAFPSFAALTALATSAIFAAWFVSIYLVVYVILLSFGGRLGQIAFGMFLASPVFVIWLVYTVIRHGRAPSRELGPDEEFGYGDRERDW